jgi:outer membrane protein OmpA-like peptidoglycan-associated protein
MVVLFLLCTGLSTASDLNFPKTEAEIVEALSQETVKMETATNGIKYVAEKGKVYKIIAGKRFRLRGLNVVEAEAVLPKAGALINFEFDSANINKASLPLLNEFGKALKNGLPDAIVLIAGHTDSRGSDAYNIKLSEKRAQSVADYLIPSHGINSPRLLIKGFGEKQPIVSDDTDENRFKNRRVEFLRIE